MKKARVSSRRARPGHGELKRGVGRLQADVSKRSEGRISAPCRPWSYSTVFCRVIILPVCGLLLWMVICPSITEHPNQGVRYEGRGVGVRGAGGTYKDSIHRSFNPRECMVDGRRLRPVELPHSRGNSSVRIYVFEDFLSSYECDNLINVHQRHVNMAAAMEPVMCFDGTNTLQRHLQDVGRGDMKVTKNDFTPGTTCVNETFSLDLKQWMQSNWSYSTAFYPGESVFSNVLARRISIATGLSETHGGKFQLTSYPVGAGYKYHTDCLEGNVDRRDRYVTVLVYLRTVIAGGETQFPDIGVSVTPRKGMALIWTNMDPHGNCDSYSRHQAAQVQKGQKFILQRWYYYQSFANLGTRPPQPLLPVRRPGQPRVSCDLYDMGSCRWYDEWDYNHLLDYIQTSHLLS